jgi:hypothetical protein
MSKPKPEPIDQALREVFESEEYKAALKGRLIAGTAKANEIALARQLGLMTQEDEDDQPMREGLQKVDREVLALMNDMTRAILRGQGGNLKIIEAGDWVGIGYETKPRVQSPAVAPETETDLLPAKKA